MRNRSAAAALSAAVLNVPAQPVRADAGDVIRTYAARFELMTSSRKSAVSEVLTLRQGATRSFVTVANANGAVLSLPTRVLADGEVASNIADPGVSCYNTAAALLASNRSANAGDGMVLVRFASGVVRIDVPLRMTRSAKGVQEFDGSGTATVSIGADAAETPVKFMTDAHLRVADGKLTQAVITTDSWTGAPPQFVNRILCSLSRVLQPAASIN